MLHSGRNSVFASLKIADYTTVTHQISQLAQYGIESHWLREPAASRRILIVYAHPDDESFGNAGTILHYASMGVDVHYACATRGECGSVEPALLEGYDSIAALRTAELMAAADVLGLAGVHFLGYRDSGMPGSDDNQHPDALVQAPIARVAAQITALIRAIQPQVVITFNPYGGYGHPDHIACHHATLAAFDAADNATLFPEQIADGLAPWRPTRLYYSTFPTAMMRLFLTAMRLRGQDPRRVGVNQDVDFLGVLENVTPITTAVDSTPHYDRKVRAWQCHKSQGGGSVRWAVFPLWVRRRLSGSEFFTRVRPVWAPGSRRERDLFG
jgi:mycothiol S-conjugate amidase